MYESSTHSSFREEEFDVCLLCSHSQHCDPQGGASFDPRGIIFTELVEVRKEMLNTKHQSSTPLSFREEEF